MLMLGALGAVTPLSAYMLTPYTSQTPPPITRQVEGLAVHGREHGEAVNAPSGAGVVKVIRTITIYSTDTFAQRWGPTYTPPLAMIPTPRDEPQVTEQPIVTVKRQRYAGGEKTTCLRHNMRTVYYGRYRWRCRK